MTRIRRGRLLAGCLLAAACLITYPWLPRVAQTVVNTGFGMAAVAAILLGIRRYRPECPAVWRLFAAGVAASALGDLVYDLICYATGGPPLVSVADLFYLAMYPLLLAGAWAGARRLLNRAAWLDAAIVAMGCALIVWATALHPQLVGAGPLTAATVLTATYPALDICLLGAVVGMLLVPARTCAYLLVVASLGLLLVADTIYAELSAHSSYEPGAVLDLVWLCSYLLWVPAALHPSMRLLGQPAGGGRHRVSTVRLAVLIAAALTVPLSAALDPTGRLDWAWTCSVTALVLLITIRLTGLIRGQQTAALTDPLTGLPNRTSLQDQLRAAMDALDPARGGLAVLCCSLDDFKLVKDTLGRPVGDELLVAVAQRLRALPRPGDMVARLGGDEFAILAHDVTAAAAHALAAGLIAGCAPPFERPERGHDGGHDGGHGSEVTLSLSVGLAHHRDGAVTPLELIQNADAALSEGKRRGRAQIQPFTRAIRTRAQSRLDLEAALRAALRAGELELHYQPQIDLRTGVITGMEALARWNRPGHGPVPPSQFIPTAEATGLIVPLGAWVITTAARQIASWDAELGRPAPPVAVNVSPRQLAASDLTDLLATAAGDAGIHPSRLVVEITESALDTDEESLLRALSRLKRLGVDIALDDFGTGYSSLSHLRLLPIDELKIDRSFVQEVTTSHRDRDLISAIVQMGRALRLRTLAEGVETAEQAAALRSLGCHIGQGFLYAAPEPAASMLTYLRTQLEQRQFALIRMGADIPAPRPGSG
ncbi:MAG: putative bifunctional diguanylate cyclase/phosphodiesterase [Frankiaceae bacterium]